MRAHWPETRVDDTTAPPATNGLVAVRMIPNASLIELSGQIVKCCQIETDVISFRPECGDTSVTLPRVCPATQVILVVLESHPAWVGLFFACGSFHSEQRVD